MYNFLLTFKKKIEEKKSLSNQLLFSRTIPNVYEVELAASLQHLKYGRKAYKSFATTCLVAISTGTRRLLILQIKFAKLHISKFTIISF